MTAKNETNVQVMMSANAASVDERIYEAVQQFEDFQIAGCKALVEVYSTKPVVEGQRVGIRTLMEVTFAADGQIVSPTEDKIRETQGTYILTIFDQGDQSMREACFFRGIFDGYTRIELPFAKTTQELRICAAEDDYWMDRLSSLEVELGSAANDI